MNQTDTASSHIETRVSATDVGRTPGDLIDRALEGPIAIERRGKVKAVLLSASEYDRLKRNGDPRVTGKVADIPDDLMSATIDSIDETLATEDV